MRHSSRMEPIERQFGAVIRRRRLKLGLSQEEYAAKAGIHRTYISSIELGKVQVSIQIAQQLADALEIPLSRIWQEVERLST
jgi:transcriptional regulator with XRE-family HTH domain